MLAMVRNSIFNEKIRRDGFLGNDIHAIVTEKIWVESKVEDHLGITSKKQIQV